MKGGTELSALEQDLLHAGSRVLEVLYGNKTLADRRREFAVLGVGASAGGGEDLAPGVEIRLLAQDSVAGELRRALRLDPSGYATARLGRSRYVVTVEPLARARAALAAYEDDILFLLRHARVLDDAGGLLPPLQRQARAVQASVWQEKAREQYRSLRRRKASIAWALRRGQPFVFLDSLARLLGHALAICLHLEGEPVSPRSRLFQDALRTPAGRRLRPALFALLSSLGEVAVLGGSFRSTENHLYRLVGDVQAAVEEAMVDAGWRRRPTVASDGGEEGKP